MYYLCGTLKPITMTTTNCLPLHNRLFNIDIYLDVQDESVKNMSVLDWYTDQTQATRDRITTIIRTSNYDRTFSEEINGHKLLIKVYKK